MTKKKLAVITSHPIQYNAPLFKLLTERNQLTVKVFYTWGKTSLENKLDPGFGKIIQWDIPLLEGYDFEFLDNEAKDKGSHHFSGIKNPDICERIDAFDPDAILVFGWAFSSHLKVLRRYHKKKKILFRGDSTLLDDPPSIKKQIRRFFLRWVYSHVDYALYVGKNNRSYFKNAGLKDSQLRYAPHAIDNDRFSEQIELKEQEAVTVRASLGIGEQEFIFLYAGKLEEVKNVDILLKAFAESGLNRISHLVIIGNGLLEAEMKKKYQEVRNMHFLDFQNQGRMPVVYRVADVFVLPSKSETWGLAVNEAMACGRAVLVSDHCGCAPDLIIPGENGYMFQSGNYNDLIKKMGLFGPDKMVSRKMGLVSLKHIAGFSYQNICMAVEKTVS